MAAVSLPPPLLPPVPSANSNHPSPPDPKVACAPFVLSFFKPTNLDYRFEDLERTLGANSDPVTGKILDLQALRQHNAAKILQYAAGCGKEARAHVEVDVLTLPSPPVADGRLRFRAQ